MTADDLSLAGRVAIVTGSGRENGIGAGIAVALARNGAAVTINYVNDHVAERAVAVAEGIRKAGGRATVVQADVSTPEGAKSLVEGTLKSFGVDHIDILVNNAGGIRLIDTLNTSKDDLEWIFALNVYAAVYMTQAVMPYMREGGRIINISSVASKSGETIVPVYNATKAALDALTYTWAGEFGKSKGITVNSIAPGPVMTDIFNNKDLTPQMREDFIARLKPLIRAADRVGTLDDIADAVLLIASEKGRWITGQFISVSGGMTGQ